VLGAFLNVKINASSCKDRAFAETLVARGTELEAQTIALEAEILQIVHEKINA
jgi:glutamate formiminotransferase/formiminotetrahydrofolate cyclodeaminase